MEFSFKMLQLRRQKILTHFTLLVLFLVFSFSDLLWADSRITKIKIEGNTQVEDSIILKAMQTKAGATLNRERLSEDIKRIYGLGFFANVIVEQESGVLLVRVVEKAAISSIIIEGNDKISEAKIRTILTVRPNMPASDARIAESKQAIVKLYKEEGYSQLHVETEEKQSPNGPVLVFKIEENKSSKIKKINFVGNKVFSTHKLKGMLKTKKRGLFSWLSGAGKFREELLERDVAFITYEYLNKGYMRVQVAKPVVEYSAKEKGMVITFAIQEGDQYKLGEINIAGDILTTKEELIKILENKPGEIYQQKNVELDLAKLQEIYGNQGYAFANIKPLTRVNDQDRTADITYAVEKGERIFVEQINITGNSITRDKIIRREIKIKENSLYNESLVRLSKIKLQQLGYFESVEFSTPRGSQDNQLVLNVNVKEKPTGSFSVGAGFSSVENFILTASISKQNFLGRGISGFLSAEISSRRQQFILNYSNPYFMDTDFIVNVNAFRMLSDYDEFRRQAFGGELQVGRRLFDFSSFSFGYKIEDVKVKDFSLFVPEFFKQNASGLTSSLSFNVRRDTRNNALVPTKGDFESFDVEYAGVGGDNNFLRLVGNARYYQPLPWDSVLKANVKVAWIKSLNGQPVPLFERFFTGGINSLRGYELRSVGPSLQIPSSATGKDERFVFGGNKLFVFNLEYEFPIYPSGGFRGVVFFDAGNAYAENEDLNPLNVRTNVGAGFRWISPFGPLRFEWGFPIKKKEGEDRSVFNFTIGSSF